MTATFIPTINFYKISPAYYISLPFSGLLYTMMTISSAKNYYFNDGNIWKEENIKNKLINEKTIKGLMSGKSYEDENFPVSSFIIKRNIRKITRFFIILQEWLMILRIIKT